MVVKGDIKSKNPKIHSLRELLVEEREKVTLLWVSGHIGIPRNEITAS
jgi:ribonuclease HI